MRLKLRLRRSLRENGRPERVREPNADALASIGIDLDEVRRRVEAEFGAGALERTRAARWWRRER